MALVRRHRRAIELALLALVAYLGALGVSTAVRGAFESAPPDTPDPSTSADAASPALAPLAAYAVIAERDLFNPPHGTAAPRGRGATSSRLQLWGVGFRGGEARAVIEDTASHHQDLYRVGDSVGGARLATIDWDHVTLAHPQGEETLELATAEPEASPPADARPADAPQAARADAHIRRTAENAFVVDRREITGAADNMSGLLTQLRAVAEVTEGRPAGFRLFEIAAGSLFSRLGLQDGDVVQRVNGTAIGDPAALLGFLQRLRTEPRVALDIVRGGVPRTLVYDLR
ncbi:MAG: hypothetical protein E6J55_05530 [Deltaproteobacteria bacterium]|nr:MAG: hypothetical protein E6J55_05530 [Deltaproteobacteria bacterium]